MGLPEVGGGDVIVVTSVEKFGVRVVEMVAGADGVKLE